MVGVLVLSHGYLARELLAAARQIAGNLEQFDALCLAWDAPQEKAKAQIREAAGALDTGEGVLILTDIFGGTPHNLAKCAGVTNRVAMISGVNLPMLLRLGCSKKSGPVDLESLVQAVEDRGRQSIRSCCLPKPDPSCAEDR